MRLEDGDIEAAKAALGIEKQLNRAQVEFRRTHVGRMSDGACTPETGLIFIDLRDRSGIVQVVFNPEVSKACHEIASEMRSEYVININGKVIGKAALTYHCRQYHQAP
jgi:uncharacterized protein (UPF0212 family)